MRVYLAVAPAELAGDEFAERIAYALTPTLRSALPDEDDEGLETSAYLAAVDAAVELAGEGGRRVVVAADSPATPAGRGEHPGAVRLDGPVAWRDVASMHVDEREAADDVRAAAQGDEAAFERAADRDLLWFDRTERDAVRADLGV